MDVGPVALTLTIQTTSGTVTAGGKSGSAITLTGSTLTLNQHLAGLQYLSAVDQATSGSISITVNDNANGGAGGALSDTIAIAVWPIVTPVASPQSYTVLVNAPMVKDAATGLLRGASGTNGRSFSVVDNTNPTRGTLQVTKATGAFTYTPNNNNILPDSFTYRITDGTTISEPATVALTMERGPNPTAQNASYSTDEIGTYGGRSHGSSVAINLATLVSDSRGTFQISTVRRPIHGEVNIAQGVATYIPDAFWNGTDSFGYTITNDLNQTSNEGVVTITVNPVNDKPVLTSTVASELFAVNQTKAISGVSFADMDGGPVALTLTIQTTSGTVTAGENQVAPSPLPVQP
jgi:hypothetical protein